MSRQQTTYFVRHTHKLDIDLETRDLLWAERRVAVHFPEDNRGFLDVDSESLNPDDYQGSARTAIRYIVQLASSGGYVCAEYHGRPQVLVGRVAPGSQVELMQGTWGDLRGDQGRKAVLKTVRMEHVKEIDPRRSAPILAARPRRGTIMQWRIVGRAIERLVEEMDAPITLADLSPDQQEVICCEFLRDPPQQDVSIPRVVMLLLPPGRTLRDLDILGLAADGKLVCGQVTFNHIDSIPRKMQQLKKYRGQDTHLVMFCKAADIAIHDGVLVVPIECVFDRLSSSDIGQKWLSLSFGIDFPKGAQPGAAD